MTVPARWLLVCYRPRSAAAIPYGIALYVPTTGNVYLRCRTDVSFYDADDEAVVGGMSSVVTNMAMDRGGGPTFEWMETSLSNTVFVLGPYALVIEDDPEMVIDTLYDQHCQCDSIPSDIC